MNIYWPQLLKPLAHLLTLYILAGCTMELGENAVPRVLSALTLSTEVVFVQLAFLRLQRRLRCVDFLNKPR